MASKGTLRIAIVGEDRQFQRTLSGITKGVAGLALGVAAAAVGVGTALFKIGADFQAVERTIRVGTGATGAALDGLKDDFRAVAAEVPDSFGEVGTAIADLNTRTGETGKSLQDLAKQVLDVSRITGTNLQSNVAAVGRVFGDWSIATEDQADTLDKLFRAAQASGQQFDTLAQQVVQFGAPLRNLGFDFETAVALMADFERSGVNIETVMSGLRQAVGRFARDGVDAGQGLREVISAIQELDSAAGTALAIETFGARAGPDLADAVRDGKFSVEELYQAIAEGADTIAQATEDTRTFGDQWNNFKNNVLLKLEEPARRVFDKMTEIMEGLIPVVTRVADAFEAEGLQGAIRVMGEEWAKAWPHIQDWLWGTALPALGNFAWDVGTLMMSELGKALIAPFERWWQSVLGFFDAIGSAPDRLNTDALVATERSLQGAPRRQRGGSIESGSQIGGGDMAFHSGGVVPGTPGSEVTARLMAGETVLPTHMPGRSAGQSLNLTVNHYGDMNERRLITEVRKMQLVAAYG